MKSSADIALVANELGTKLFINGDTAWSIAGHIIDTLDQAHRLAPTADDAAPICEDCHRTYTGPGRLCPSCRNLEDGHEPPSYAELCATVGYADDEAVF